MPNSTVPAAATGLPSRQDLERLIEEAIALLDAIDGDTDLEPDADLEPSLGYYLGTASDCDLELDKADLEPSLGSLDGQIDQTMWNAGSAEDAEEGDDDEPDIGWSNPMGLRFGEKAESVPTRRIRRHRGDDETGCPRVRRRSKPLIRRTDRKIAGGDESVSTAKISRYCRVEYQSATREFRATAAEARP